MKWLTAVALVLLFSFTNSFSPSLLLSSSRLLQQQQLKLNAADPERLQFVESVDLSNWGVFQSTNVTLTNKPVCLTSLYQLYLNNAIAPHIYLP
jgi:hypothetical protein